MAGTAPAYTINGFTRPELNFDPSGNIIIAGPAADAAAAYGTKFLYLGLPASTPYPPVTASLSVPTDANAAPNSVAEGAATNTPVGLTVSAISTGGLAVTYALTADSSGGGFRIDPVTGVVSVANGALLDYETHPSHAYSVTVQASDGTFITSQSFAIGLTDVNDNAPVFSSGASAATPENVSTATPVYTAHATDADGTAANSTVTYSLGSGGDNALFNINHTTGAVTFKVSPNFETPADAGGNNVYDIAVTASDGLAAHNVTQNVAITVADLAPVISPAAAAAAATEGTPITNVVYTAVAADPGGGAVTYALTGTDAAAFTIDPTTGAVTFNAVPDFETQASYSFNVKASDASGMFVTQAVTINLNDLPPVITSPTAAAVNENVAPNTAVYTAVAADPAGGTVTYALTGADAAAFTVDPATGIVTINASPDFETRSSYSFNIKASDPSGQFTTQAVVISVNDVNDNAPVITSSAAMAVNEASTGGTAVGTVVATDADGTSPNNIVSYSVTGGTGQALFDLNPNSGAITVHAGALLDFETTTSYTLDVKATDGGAPALSTTQTVTISLNDLAPVFATPPDSNASGNQTSDAAPTGSSTGIHAAATDPAGGTVTYSLFDDAGGRFAIDPVTGVVTVGTTPIVFDSVTAANNNVTITVRASDPSGAHTDHNFSLVILQETPPDITAGNTLNYTENQAPTAIDPALTVTDSNNATLASASVQITVNYVIGEDLLAFANTPNITGSFDAASGTLTLTGIDTVANYQAALRAVTYVNTSDNPSGAPRTVAFSANDGTVDSAAATDTINVTPVNDAPVIGAGHSLGYTENQAATAIDTALTLTDPDSASLTGATVQITGNYVNGEDILAFANTTDITGVFNAATGTLTLSGTDSVANYQAALRAVTYFDNSDNPSGLTRTVTFTATDGAATSTAVTDSITVTPVNDAPVVVAGHALTFTENDAATVIDAAVTVTDVDSANLSSATVQITGNYVSGEDVLSFVNQNGITGSFNASTGTLTLSGSSSVTNYQTALDSVKYVDNSTHPSSLDRTVTYIVSDGAASSTAVTSIIHVVPVNTAPDLTPNAPPAAAYTENAAATALLSSGAVTDGDAPANFSGGSFTAAITANAATGDEIVLLNTSPFAVDGSSLLLAGSVVGSISGLGTDSVSVTGFTTAATPTVVNLLVKAFGFLNSTDDPATAARTVTFTFHDGGNTGGGDLSDSVTQTVNVTAVNDAPVNTVPSTTQTTDTATDLAISGISVSDVDSEGGSETTTLHVANGTLAVASAGGASVGGSGTATVTLTGTIDQINITLAAANNILYHPGAAGADTLTVTTNDGGHSPSGALQDTDTVPIFVTAPGGAPVLDLDGSAGGTGFTNTFTENGTSAPIADTDDTITDATSTTIASATITLTNHQASDLLSVNGTLPAGISASSYNATTGVLTLTGTALLEDYRTALQQIEFSNGSDNPDTADRSIAVVVNDGTGDSNTAFATIHVTAVNDAPVVDLDGSTLGINFATNYTATGGFIAIASSTDIVTDADNTTLQSATITLTDAQPNDVLAISGALPSGITAAIDTSVAGQITVTLTGSASPASYQAALHQVVFANSSTTPDLSDRHVDVTVSDGTDSSAVATTTITVADNAAPVANDDAGSATEAGGVNNATAGINPSGNLITGTGAAGAVADTDDLDPATALRVVAVHTGSEIASGPAGTVGVALQGTYGTLMLNADGSYSYSVDNNNATVQGLLPASPAITDVFNYTIEDTGGLQDTATLTISIHGANDLPLAVADTGTMTEDAAPTTFAVLGNDATDPDSGALNTIATGVVSASGPAGTNIDATDVSVAVIGGTQVQVTLGADFQRLTGSETATVTVPYTLTGNTGETSTANLVVTVNGVNDLPVAVNDLVGNSMTEDAAATTFSVLGNDTLDKDHTATNNITTGTVTASGPAGTNIDGSDVTVSVTGAAGSQQIQLTLGSDFQHLQAGQTATIDVPYTLHGDGADASTATLEVTVTGLNDAPVVTAGAGATFTENGAAVSVAGSLTLTDVDNTTMSGATVSLTNAQASDVLSVQGQGASGDLASGIHFVVDNTAHTVTFSNVEAATDYQAALRLVQFSNSSENPSTTARSFTITADDGQTLNHTGSATASVAVIAVDDAPVNTVPSTASLNAAFSHTPFTITGLDVSDVDSGTGLIRTTLSVDNGGITLTLASGSSVVAGSNGGGTVTIEGTVASIHNTLANNAVYQSADGFTGQATVTVSTTDQGNTGTGGPLTDSDSFKIGVVPQVWYIDNSNAGAGTGTGTAADPFHTIHDFNVSAGPGQGDYIVLRTGTGTYSGEGLNLQNNQQVYGAGETLSFTNPAGGQNVTILNGTGTRPTINVTASGDQGIDLATGNAIHGVNITTAAGTTGLDDGEGAGGNSVGSLTIDHMAISGAGSAVDIDHGGALAVTLESVGSSGGAQGIQLAGVAGGTLGGTFTVTGNVNITNSAVAGIDIGSDGGTVTFSGSSNVVNTGTHTAVSLTNNTGGTVNFTNGGLDIDTTSGAGFVAIGGGTVTVQGTGNHLTSTTGTALNITNTTIGAGNVTFQDISANGGSNGIILNNTGSSGHLAVTGTGTAAGSGGTIQNETGADILTGTDAGGQTVSGTQGVGIFLQNTAAPTFSNMLLSNFSNFGIYGNNVTGFTLANSTISGSNGNNNAGDREEGSIRFDNLLGTASITGSSISGGFDQNIDLYNTSGTLTRLTMDSDTFGLIGSTGNDNVRAQVYNSATANFTLTNSTFAGTRADFIAFIANNNTHMDAVVRGNTFHNGQAIIPGGGSAVDIRSGSAGFASAATTTYDISHNTLANTGADAANAYDTVAIFVAKGQDNGTMSGTIASNVIGPARPDISPAAGNQPANADGIFVRSAGAGTDTVLIQNNTITGYGNAGIHLQNNDGSSTMNASVFGNTESSPNGVNFSGIFADNGATATDTSTMNLVLGSNQAGEAAKQNTFHGGVIDVSLSNFNASTHFNLSRNGSASGTPAGVVQDDNVGTPTVDTTGGSGPVTLVNTLPALPAVVAPLLAATGGVQASTPTPGETHLTQSELDQAVAAAIALWAHAGASATQLAALAAITFNVADLSGDVIGEQSAGHITIDTNAAGHGWFVDSTPSDNLEFTHAANGAGTDLYTDPTNAAAGHLDLLTTVAHEMGHELGLPDSTAASDAHDLMYIGLVDGERRLPDSHDVASSNTSPPPASQAAVPAAATATATMGIGGAVVAAKPVEVAHDTQALFNGTDHFVFAPAAYTGAPAAPPSTQLAYSGAAPGDTFDFVSHASNPYTPAYGANFAAPQEMATAAPGGSLSVFEIHKYDASVDPAVHLAQIHIDFFM